MLDEAQLQRWLFGAGTRQRRTQDSPIMPDVWYAYGAPGAVADDPPAGEPLTADEASPAPVAPAARVDLLLRPHAQASAAQLAQGLAERLGSPAATELAHNDAYVVCRLTLDELLGAALPLSPFWQRQLWPGERRTLRELVGDRLEELAAHFGGDEPRRQGRRAVRRNELPGNVVWLVGLAGRIGWELRAGSAPGGTAGDAGDAEPPADVRPGLPPAIEVARAGLALLGDAPLGGRPEDALLWSISRNRRVLASVWQSRVTCKADAATRLFGLSCRDIRWAVIDSGIDARHPAFARRVGDAPVAESELAGAPGRNTRVLATWDFSRVRAVLAAREPGAGGAGEGGAAPEAGAGGAGEGGAAPEAGAGEAGAGGAAPAGEGGAAPEAGAGEAGAGPAAPGRATSGGAIDWDAIAPLLAIEHDEGYEPPKDDHGTHVAGVLASDWRAGDTPSPGADDVVGMCPDIELYDLRAFGRAGTGEEFDVLSAMQFVRHLNANSDRPLIHGVNLSFSIPHKVTEFAAGRTPVCEEAHRLVAAGVVAVAAAGNDGRGGYVVRGRAVEGYRTVSISDPGNAERVITVGATHRRQPHIYGVSYFSSRGPTGDGRAKPDLVAPGEKISAPVPGGGLMPKDGTSQAAPHVSGACALLLARHPELIGDPERVKQILLATCTDLGREPAFQGAGLVDVLRAIGAV